MSGVSVGAPLNALSSVKSRQHAAHLHHDMREYDVKIDAQNVRSGNGIHDERAQQHTILAKLPQEWWKKKRPCDSACDAD